MAKFSACFHLCPLIDQKNFLGVTDESINGCVIISLGKNMVIRYKLSDQKQVSSWSSKDKLSAPVVYDSVSKRYIGVFNASQLSTWEESCVHLNDLKKLKFSSAIDRVLASPCSAEPVVVFRSGHIAPLQMALDKRKHPLPKTQPLNEGEIINDAHLISLIGTVIVALFTTTAQNVQRLHLLPVEPGLLSPSCLPLTRKAEGGVSLIGHALVAHEKTCHLLTLWSDGQLFSVGLPTREPEQFPGRLLATLTAISARHPAAILPLSASHVAVYGADASEEGALLFIFNTQLCVTQCKQYFKLYTTPARLWNVGSSAVLLAAGQYLAVVPYHLGKQRLAALVGSQEGDAPPATVQEWGEQTDEGEVREEHTQQHLQKLMHMYMEEGMSQKMISQSLFLPTLDACDVEGLASLLKTLTDIPETCIVSVIMFCLKDIEREGHRELLRSTLQLPVTPDLTTLRLLRSRMGLWYVLQLLREVTEALLQTPHDPRLLEWATLLLDAHYQQYLLSRDRAVIETLTELKAVVDKQIEDMEVWQDLEPLLLQLKNQQGLPDHGHLVNNTYSIEQIKLY